MSSVEVEETGPHEVQELPLQPVAPAPEPAPLPAAQVANKGPSELAKPPQSSAGDSALLRQAAQRGLELCRAERWKDGLVLLGKAARRDPGDGSVPPVIYSFLGYGCARFEHKIKAGMALCGKSLKAAPDQPEVYLNLARIYHLVKNRKETVRWLSKGLAIDSKHPGLVGMRKSIGMRQRPAISALDRKHPINRALGKFRSRRRQKKNEA